MSQRWYYLLCSEEFGPVTEPQIRQLLGDGTLAADDLVRPESSQTWLALSESFSVIPASVADADDLTDLSELEFSFEESRTSTRRAANRTADQSERAIRFDDSRPTTGRGPRSTEPVPAATSSAPTLPERLSLVSEGATTESQLMYFCQSFGQTMGPMTIAELAGMAETGSLTDSDLVQCGELGDWFPAGELAELAATLMLVDRMTPAPPTVASGGPHRLERVAAAELKTTAEKTNHPVETPKNAPRASEPTRTGSDSSSGAVRDRPVRKKGSPKKEKNREDALLSDIFDEVFAEEEKPARSTPSVYSAASNASVASPVASVASPSPAMAPSPLMSASAAAAASAARSSHGPTLSARKSSSGSSFEMPGKGVVIAVVLFVATAGYIYQFGMPSLSFITASPDTYPARLKAVMDEFKALGASPTQQDWKSFSESTRAEFMNYYTYMRDAGMSDPKDKVCMSAVKLMIDLTTTSFNQQDFRDKQIVKLEKLILELNK